jgi:polysaccharide biosynthesis/export protein
MKNIFLILIMFLTFLFSQSAKQVIRAKTLMGQLGLSENEAIEAAKIKGFTDSQIEKAIQAGKPSKQSQGELVGNLLEVDNLDPIIRLKNELTNNETLVDVEMLRGDEEDIDRLNIIDKSAYFGYKIFQQDPSLFQATSIGAVDPNYIIGPGDEIIVMLWGETQFRQVLSVDREGFVFIPEIGQVSVNGLSLTLLESKLFRVFSQSYASLNPQGRKPSTFLDVSLGKLRPLRIQVLGEVAQPGAYTVSPTATLFSALYYFKGPTLLGSLRDIRLIRGDNQIASIDFYDYLLTGKKPKDQKLQLDDVIFIPSRLKTISIKGAVNRTGTYELMPKETLSDLILMAGGLKVTAYLDRSVIDRIVPFEDREKLGMDRMYTDVNLQKILKSEEDFYLYDGDSIEVFSVFDSRPNAVDIIGSISRPGRYDIGDSLKISELINKADGLLGDAYLEKADIVRTKPDFTKELIKINVNLALKADPKHNLKLQGLDKIRVYGMSELVSEKYVYIRGHVKSSGRFLLQENMTAYDLIFMAGGILDQDYKKQTLLKRADLIRFNDDKITTTLKSFNLGTLLLDPDSDQNFLLNPDDIIQIYEKSISISKESVVIEGIVRKPGTFDFKKNMTIQDLIIEAGGLNKDSYGYKVEIGRIDPANQKAGQYAEIITFEMDQKFEIKNLIDISPIKSLNHPLKPYDFVSVRPNPRLSFQRKIFIDGSVNYPGSYVLSNSKETIDDIVTRAGGLTPDAYAIASSFKRNGSVINVDIEKILRSSFSANDIVVQDKDSIFIAKKPNLTTISGMVRTPGLYQFFPGMRVDDYIKLAGGFTAEAEKKDVWIIFPNGKTQKYNRMYNNPKVLDGSKINIGNKVTDPEFSLTKWATELTNIIADITQAYAIISLLIKNQ